MSYSSGDVCCQEQRRRCCISHVFSNSATLNPDKIAAIRVAPSLGGSGEGGGDGVSRPKNSRKFICSGRVHPTADSFASGSSSCYGPPVYEGDECFTFGDVVKAVDSLASLFRSILDADDPYLILPQSSSSVKSNYTKQRTSGRSKSAVSFIPSLKPLVGLDNVYKPKILGLYMPPSVEYIVSVLSVLRCGEAFLPLDPSWPKDRILSVVSSANVDLIVTSESSFYDDDYDDVEKSGWLVEFGSCPVLSFSMKEIMEGCSSPLQLYWPCEKEQKRLFCYVLYTSGSTGEPKGVCGTEQGLLNRFMWMQELYPLHEGEILLIKTSISFIDHLQEFLGAMLAACTLVIPPFNELRKVPFSIVNFLQAYSINRLIAVPSLMRVILPTLKIQSNTGIGCSLKLLVLSGEVFLLSLWDELSSLLPRTSILNLYGSTEVSGDCMYFDCKMLPTILDTEALTSVPIGVPISNCDVLLVGENDTTKAGEIYVGGLCVSIGYIEASTTSLDYIKMHKNYSCNCCVDDCGSQVYYRTGDFARRLPGGDLVFLGRKDRTIKVHGQRVALEEIEIIIRAHPDVIDVAVISRENSGELSFLTAFLVLRHNNLSGNLVRSSVRSWLSSRVPLAMIPNRFVLIESLPMSSSGKVDYALLASSTFFTLHLRDDIDGAKHSDNLEMIKKAFCEILLVEEVCGDDDFFMMGGDSVSAAHLCYNLGIDMRLLYNFPTPSKLHVALVGEKVSLWNDVRTYPSGKLNLRADNWNMVNSVSAGHNIQGPKSQEWLLKNPNENNDNTFVASKRMKVNVEKHILSKFPFQRDGFPWPASSQISCSFSRCNKVMHDEDCALSNTNKVLHLTETSRKSKGPSLRELWKVDMESCVDASPLVVFKDHDAYIFIGSHAHNFVCINAKSGSVQWGIKLEGRIECSAAIVGDFSQVVVGCYEGKIYFLDFFSGNTCWTFQTCGEVKCQPVVDVRRQLIWCGSHDHHLYALDYKNHHCVYRLACGGSIYGSPAVDEAHDTLYVASTSGRVTAVSIKAVPFYGLWQHELQVPVFGSLSVCSSNGNVVCCLVDGNIVVLDLRGSIVWKCRVGGPVFAGPCVSCVLPSQILVCSRNGSVYSFGMEKGDLLWEYDVGNPITASAYVDEHLQLVSSPSHLSDRLICVCASSGSIHLLRIKMNVFPEANQPNKSMVEEISSIELLGDIFSSPVMIGGWIFVGCRDDYVHCLTIQTDSLVEEVN